MLTHVSLVQGLVSAHWASLLQQPLTGALVQVPVDVAQLSVVQGLLSLHSLAEVQHPETGVC